MRFSASSLPLLIDCAATANPSTWQAPDKMGPAAYVGNAVHRLAEWHLTRREADVRAACGLEGVRGEDQDRVARLWANLADWLGRQDLCIPRAEIAYGYAPETGEARALGRGIGRMYKAHGQRQDELAGTADLVHCDVGGTGLTVCDWKTGKGDAESYRWQLRLLGLAAAREVSADSVTIHIVRISEVDVDDTWSEVLDAHDLDDVAAEVLRVWREAPTAEPKAGAWCEARYCRARSKCAAYRDWRAA